MNPIIKKIHFIVGIFLVFSGFGGFIFHRFSNPDMTDIRYIIDFWHIWGGAMSLMLLGLLLYRKGTK